MPTALERPSPLRRGTAISAPVKSTSGNEPMSMGMPNINDRDLGHRVDNIKRSSGTDEIKNGAMNHGKEQDYEGDSQEGELHSGQRRDKVRQTSYFGHFLHLFLALSSSTCSRESSL